MLKLLIKNLITKTDCIKVADPGVSGHSSALPERSTTPPGRSTTPPGRSSVLHGRSLQIRHLDCGSCNGCDFELAALLNPIYDIQRYGFDFVASPRHADVLAVTGIVTRNLMEAALATYGATPDPKLVVAIGDCAVDGGVFDNTRPTEGNPPFAVIGPVEKVLPVDLKIPGCPPSPEEILKALLKLDLNANSGKK